MRIAIIGAAELGKLIAAHAPGEMDVTVIGYYDDNNSAGYFNDLPILGKTDAILKDFHSGLFDSIMIGIGYNHMNARAKLFEQFKGIIPFANIIHSSSYVDKSCKLGEGIFILPGVVLDYEVEIGDNVLLNTGTIVAHHSKIGTHSFIAPGVKIAGLVRVGSKCFIGIGSNLKDSIEIGDFSIIGAGSLVLKNIENNSVYMGAPAKFIRNNSI
jgi:sugar O-acyltransferase (sialic acid O-acetyltransferase NeuD family)